MQTLLVLLLAVPSGAAERGTKAPSAMAARRAAAQPSTMAVRRAEGVHRSLGASLPSGVPAPAPAAVPAATPEPEFGPRITPPKGSPATAVDLRRNLGVAYAPATDSPPDVPLPAVAAEGAPGAGPERAPTGVKGAAVAEIRAGRTDRQFGGASDPVLFLVGGTGPSGSVTSNADGSNLSIQLGGQQR